MPTAAPEWRAAAAGGAVCLWSTGFIANRRELSAEVGPTPAPSDPGLLERLFGKLGDRAAEHIAGSFAWIVWEPGRRRLVSVGDRQGMASLYYSIAGDTFLLATSFEDLLRQLSRPPVLHRRAAAEHLVGEGPLPGETFCDGVAVIERGQVLDVVDACDIKSRHYWSIEPRPVRRASDAEHASAFRDLLFQVVEEYLPAAPFGVTLSGGLDSTSVTAALVVSSPGRSPVPLLWTAPELPEADERAQAHTVCRLYGLRPEEIRADLLWPLRHRDRPRVDPADPLSSPYEEVWEATFERARERGLRVLFTGASGDNLFGGNAFSYPDLVLTGRWLELARQLREHLPHSELGLRRILHTMVLAPIRQAYLPRRRRPAGPDWLTEESWELIAGARDQERLPYWLLPGRKQHLRQMRERILPRIMAHLTRRAAAHGIELRNPLLDHRLFELAASLPTSQVFRAAERKIVIRNAMRPYLPAEVIDRRTKIYPVAIFERGVREREARKVEALLTGMRAAELGFVDEEKLRSAYRDYRAGKDRSARFWHALTLESWLREYFA